MTAVLTVGMQALQWLPQGKIQWAVALVALGVVWLVVVGGGSAGGRPGR